MIHNASWLCGLALAPLLAAGGADAASQAAGQILWRNANGDVSLWMVNGGTITSSTNLGVVPAAWTIAGRGDFNGDGQPDMLWRNTNGDVVIWFMNGGRIASSADLGVIPTAWTIAGTGDFNGDGKADILWRNANGDVSVWFMNGTAIGHHGQSRHHSDRLDHPGHRRFQRRRQDRHPLAQHQRRRDVWFMNGGAIASAADFGHDRRDLDHPAPAISTVTARPTSSGATPMATRWSGS